MVLKLSALLVTALGLLVALDLALNTNKQLSPVPERTPYLFSNIFGFYPSLIHRLAPKITLILGQHIATQMIDLIWFEKTGPKTAISINKPGAQIVSNTQHGNIKVYLITLFLTLTISIIFISTI